MLLKHDRRTARRSTQVLEPVTSLRARHFLAYFAGEQPLRRATVLAVIGVPTISLVAMYVIGAVTPEDDAAAFAVYWLATTNVAMGIALSDGGVDLETGRIRLQLAEEESPYLAGPRTGLSGPGGGDDYPWRFWVPGAKSVSPYKRHAPKKVRTVLRPDAVPD